MAPTKKVVDPVDTSTWLTRSQASDLLHVSDRTLKDWEQDGTLHPQRADRVLTDGRHREVVVYDPRELAAISARRVLRTRVAGQSGDGEISARAFEAYEDGVTCAGVVVKLRITPERAQELYDQWERMGGIEVVLGPRAREELVRLVGPFDGVPGLVQRLREVMLRLQELQVVSPSEADVSREEPSSPSLGESGCPRESGPADQATDQAAERMTEQGG